MTFRSIWSRQSVTRAKPFVTLFTADDGPTLDTIGGIAGIRRATWISPATTEEVPESDFHYRQDIVEAILNLAWRTAKQPDLTLEALARTVGIPLPLANDDTRTREWIILACNNWKKGFDPAQRSMRATNIETERHDTIRSVRDNAPPTSWTVPKPGGFMLPEVCNRCGIVHKHHTAYCAGNL
jgi:hypothetical protein